MSNVDVKAFFAHYGVKGMRWGVRDGASGPTDVTVKTTPGKKVKTQGGKQQPASEDAVRNAITRQKAKKSTTDALSTKELQELVLRMNLEQQYSRLAPRSPAQQAAKFISSTMLNIGKQQGTRLASDLAAQQVGNILKKS